MYENLAAKYRPRNFSEVLGQDTIKTTLANSVKLDRLAHAYVFYGPRGCGKTTIARILAKTLNCRKSKNEIPCDKCPSCLEIAESRSLDVIEIDAASNTDVDHVRNVIIEHVDLSPSRDKYKIYILDEVQMLSKAAFNALLKTIEEPPAHVVFVMATTEQTKVPLTILSRSQCFRFRPIPQALIAERLKEVASREKLKASDEALAIIAKAAGGAMRDALTLLDRAASFGKGSVQAEVLNELLGHAGADLIMDVAAALVKRDQAALYAGFEKIAKEGYDPLTVLRDLRNALAETFLYLQKFSKTGTALAGVLDKDFSPAALARLSRKLNAVIDEVKFSDAPSMAAEIALFTLAETPQDLDGLVKRLEALEGRLASGAAAPAVPIPEPPVKQDGTVQKKNERLAPQPPADPPGPETPQPRPAPAPSMPSSALWKKLLSGICAKKPVLYNILLSAKVAFEQDHSWKLSSSNKFEAVIIEKAREELEEIMERVSGRKINFTVEHDPPIPAQPAADDAEISAEETEDAVFVEDTPSPPGPSRGFSEKGQSAVPAPQVSCAVPEPAAKAPAQEVKWEDVGASIPAEEEAELKKLSKVFHGRIARIQKIK
ncbi:MAG: DNA polymerase III subunit gamma/tau [Elusimicrobia bacterium]|nr:DNA polymerase III subunit gamma/tau [Elusimicrobiota bacterium]